MIKSFLMLGQSNMAGHGFLHEVAPIYNEQIKMLRNGQWQMMTEPIQHSTEHRQVNEQLKQLSYQQQNCYFVTATGLTANPDGIHLDGVLQRKFGFRYFAAFSKECHVLEPISGEEQSLKVERDYSKTEQISV